MGKIKKIVTLGMIAVSSMVFAGCNMIQKTPEAIQNETLAKVGNQKITRAQVDELMKPLYDQYEKQFGANYMDNAQVKAQVQQKQQQVLENLVDREVILEKAKKENWMPSEEEVNKQVNEQYEAFKKNFKTEDQLKQALNYMGYSDENQLKNEVKEDVTVQTIINEHILKDVKVTDDEVKKYYDENKATTYTTKPGADVYNIVLPDEKTAKEVRAEIESGKATFADMAAKYNTDSTKTTGGSLGHIDYDSTQYVPEFMDAMKKLKDGEISQPVKTQYGYHLIKVENINTKSEVIPFDKVKDSIKSNLEKTKKNTAYNDALTAWKKEIGVKVYEDRLQK